MHSRLDLEMFQIIMEMVELTCTGQLANVQTKNSTRACIECWYCAKYRVSMIIH